MIRRVLLPALQGLAAAAVLAALLYLFVSLPLLLTAAN